MAPVLKATLILQTKNRSANSKYPPVCPLALSAVFWLPLRVGCDGEHVSVPGLRLQLANWHRSFGTLDGVPNPPCVVIHWELNSKQSV